MTTPGHRDTRAQPCADERLRIVHFVSPGQYGDEGPLACRETLSRADMSHRVCVIGTARDAERVRRLGVRVDGVISAAVRSGLIDRGFNRLVLLMTSDAPCAWVACSWSAGLSLLGNAAMRLGAAGHVVVETRGPAAAVLDEQAGLASGLRKGLLRAVFVGAGEPVAKAWQRAGATDVRVAPLLFSPPAAARVEIPPDNSGMDAATPRSDAQSGSPHVIGLLADPASLGDARQFVFVLGLLYAAGLRVDGLVPAGAMNIRRAARFLRDHGRRWGLREWTGPVHDLARVCNALVCPARIDDPDQLSAGPAVFAAARSAGRPGLPIIAHDGAEAQSLLASGFQLVTAQDSKSVTLAARLLDCLTYQPTRANQGPVTSNGPMAAGQLEISFGRVVGDVLLEAAAAGPRLAEVDAMLARR
ncbi:MAG: hypothetical protein H7210_07845 [Pyrinomonadaceae bacterium]|nr:hypothetical protein [Phycisphaerales bacterium]